MDKQAGKERWRWRPRLAGERRSAALGVLHRQE